MDYIGSKEKLNDWIFDKVKRHFSSGVFLDGCSGSGSVSRAAASRGYKVVSNDLLTFPSYMAKGSITPSCISGEYHVDKMNSLPGVEGFFYKNYSEAGGRLYFTKDNAKKIDACRQYLDQLGLCVSSTSSVADSAAVRSYLMYCLLEAMSRISNTAGTHGAYLKQIKSRAEEPLEIRQEATVPGTLLEAHTGNILDLLNSPREWKEDILYLDPPYNQRQYAPNYHLYETLVRYDEPTVEGTTGLRDYDDQKSDFCAKKKVLAFTEEVLKATRARLVLISYSSDGTMSLAEMEEMLCRLAYNGEVSVHVKAQRRYKADNSRDNDDSFLREYLFEILRPESIL